MSFPFPDSQNVFVDCLNFVSSRPTEIIGLMFILQLTIEVNICLFFEQLNRDLL